MHNQSVLASISSSLSNTNRHIISMAAQPPHDALFLALPYLSVQELLAMSETCSSLRDSVRNDDGVLPWQNVVVEKPLSRRLTDASLARVASMAGGNLKTLALIDCLNVTDDGLQRVVQTNPLIDKLIIPGCTALTPEGVIRAVTPLSSIKTLHINGIYNIEKHHLENLLSLKKDITMDLETCPRCDNSQLVFSCPREECSRNCRACTDCVPRCKECRVCVDALDELEELLCSDLLCSDCWLKLPKCSFCNKPYCSQHAEEKEVRVLSSSGRSGGFVCDNCQAESVEYSGEDE